MKVEVQHMKVEILGLVEVLVEYVKVEVSALVRWRGETVRGLMMVIVVLDESLVQGELLGHVI